MDPRVQLHMRPGSAVRGSHSQALPSASNACLELLFVTTENRLRKVKINIESRWGMRYRPSTANEAKAVSAF